MYSRRERSRVKLKSSRPREAFNISAVKNALRLSGLRLTRSVSYNTDWRHHWLVKYVPRRLTYRLTRRRSTRALVAGINLEDVRNTEQLIAAILEAAK